jgi:hypothetical protein
VAVEEEQRGYDRFFDAPMMELNPAVGAFQTLTVRKWDEFLKSDGEGTKKSGREHAPLAS